MEHNEQEERSGQREFDFLENDSEAEWDDEGECSVCGIKGVYQIEDVGYICPDCAETFQPR